jgi:hypothetical protein
MNIMWSKQIPIYREVMNIIRSKVNYNLYMLFCNTYITYVIFNLVTCNYCEELNFKIRGGK